MPTDQYGFAFDPTLLKSPAPNDTFTPLFPTPPLTTKSEEQIRSEADQDYANKNSRPKWSRQPMIWELYDGTMIEMYVNPQSVSLQANKKISQNRTKGGFVVQYWGDELLTINLNGTTGSSGIEGIEILYDLYQSELLSPGRLDELRGVSSGSGYLASIPGVNPGGTDKDELMRVRRTDLVTRATQVVLWYGSKRYYGFFTAFSIQEAATTPGEYTYTLAYTVWKTVGRDVNYMPWHRSPKPMATGNSGVPEAPGSVSIYAIQGAGPADTQSAAKDPISSQSSPSASIAEPEPPRPPMPETTQSGVGIQAPNPDGDGAVPMST